MGALHLARENFSSTVSSGTVLVDFWAGWCMPCKMLAPVIEELAEELAGAVTVAKLDIDAEEAIAMEYGIMSIPTVILFRDGREVRRIVGVHPKEVYLQALPPEAAGGADRPR